MPWILQSGDQSHWILLTFLLLRQGLCGCESLRETLLVFPFEKALTFKPWDVVTKQQAILAPLGSAVALGQGHCPPWQLPTHRWTWWGARAWSFPPGAELLSWAPLLQSTPWDFTEALSDLPQGAGLSWPNPAPSSLRPQASDPLNGWGLFLPHAPYDSSSSSLISWAVSDNDPFNSERT